MTGRNPRQESPGRTVEENSRESVLGNIDNTPDSNKQTDAIGFKTPWNNYRQTPANTKEIEESEAMLIVM